MMVELPEPDGDEPDPEPEPNEAEFDDRPSTSSTSSSISNSAERSVPSILSRLKLDNTNRKGKVAQIFPSERKRYKPVTPEQ